MTIKEVAELFNGRQYGREGTQADFDGLGELGFVVVFGASDDLCELRGAINDEADCYNGGTIYLDADGVFYADCENEDCKLLQRHLKTCKTIEAVWCDGDYPWTYKTDIPHECFDIYEDGEKYCRGIVFDTATL